MAQAKKTSRFRRPRWFDGRIWTSDRGATAVEFALVAVPLVFVLMATFDIAMVYLISNSLNSATITAARQIKTGQMQHVSETQSGFAAVVCNNMGWLTNQCLTNISVGVQSFSSFSTVAPPAPVSNGVFNASTLPFNMGNAGDVVLVKVYYQWPLATPFLDYSLQALNNGNVVIVSTAVFRNEPYS